MKLIAISDAGEPESAISDMPNMARDILRQTASLYRVASYVKPWVGYLAVESGACIGFCAFKSTPHNQTVEIAYASMPEYEGRGIATRMARRLIKIAQNEAPDIIIRAQTLPEENASTSVLRKLGFEKIGDIDHPEDGRVWEWRLPPQL